MMKNRAGRHADALRSRPLVGGDLLNPQVPQLIDTDDEGLAFH